MRAKRFKTIIRGLIFTTAISCIAIAQPAFSQAKTEPRYSLDEAVAIVKQSVSGEVLRAKMRQKDGRTVYEIRVLTDDGLVRNIIFDAEDGLEK